AEGRVRRAAGAPAGQGEVVAGARTHGRAGHDDPAVRLDGDGGVGEGAGGQVPGARAAEGSVQAAVRVVARHHQRPLSALISDDDLAGVGGLWVCRRVKGHVHKVAVHREGEVRDHLAARPEGHVQAAVGVVTYQGKVIGGPGDPGHHYLAVRL